MKLYGGVVIDRKSKLKHSRELFPTKELSKAHTYRFLKIMPVYTFHTIKEYEYECVQEYCPLDS